MKELTKKLKEEFDYILIDCPAGIEQGFKNAIAGADRAIVVTTAEISAIRDADRIIGLLESSEIKNPELIINKIRPSMVRRGEMMEKFKDKVYIIVDNSYRVGEINALLNKYYDWFFQIDKISENDKKDYIINLLTKNQININKECNYIDKLAEEPFFIVKSRINHIILKCKITNTNEITDEFAEKYLENQEK